MTSKTIAQQTWNLIYSKQIALRIQNAQSTGMWVPCQMSQDWLSLHVSLTDRLKRCWWQSMQSTQGGITEWRTSRTECVNVSPASLCILTKSFSWIYIMGEWWAVACEYWLINRCIAGAMELLARYLNFSHVKAKRERMLLRSDLPQGQVSICQNDYQ